MGGGSGFGNGDPQSAPAPSRPRQFNLGQISSSRRDQALVRRVELRSIRLAKKVDRAVPCSMLKRGEAALIEHRPTERPIHLMTAHCFWRTFAASHGEEGAHL